MNQDLDSMSADRSEAQRSATNAVNRNGFGNRCEDYVASVLGTRLDIRLLASFASPGITWL